MPNWKKLAYSGSDPTFNSLYVANSVTASKFLGNLYENPSPDTTSTVYGILTSFRANENQVFGDAVFINSTGSAQIGNATNISSSYTIGISISSASGNTNSEYLLNGIARHDGWNWTVGGAIYLSTTGTSGTTMTQNNLTGSDQVTQIMGIATHADRMYVNPQLIQITTL